MADQSGGSVAHYSNCFAALYAAAGWAANTQGAEMLANAGTAQDQVTVELGEFGGSWTVHVPRSAQFVSHPRSFQSSWMTESRLRSMIQKERHAISGGKLASLQGQYNHDMSEYNSLESEADGPHGGDFSGAAGEYYNDAQSLTPEISTYKSLVQKGGNLSTVSELNKAWDAMRGGSFQSHPNVNTSQFAQSYLNHAMGSNVTIPEFQRYIASLVRNQAPNDQILAAQQLLNEAKTEHNNATTDVQQGVQQAQNALSQNANMGKVDIGLVESLNETLQACAVGRWSR